ncbi:hypothetical protein RIF29_43341 [Crotalaria pallida]|uniref:Ribosomal protein S19 n=1 Tax=Crotalaria pallida TaxID=3830 RepID=A0AAN9HR38_CROPI
MANFIERNQQRKEKRRTDRTRVESSQKQGVGPRLSTRTSKIFPMLSVGQQFGEFASTRKRRLSRTNIKPGRKKGKK